MGLGIYVHKNLNLAANQPETSDFDDDQRFDKYLVMQGEAEGDRIATLPPGDYDHEEVFYFHAGSYSGYNQWRAMLSKLMLGVTPEEVWESPERFKGDPFIELINFSDCEGFIAGDAAKKLAKDFEDNLPEVLKEFADGSQRYHDEYFLDKYKNFMKAFKIAATESGCVQFS